MKSVIRMALLLIIATAILSSCTKPVPKITRHIPKNASVVIGINTKSLYSKLEKNQDLLAGIFRSHTGSDTSGNTGRQEWEDLKNSGLDLQEKFYVSVIRKGGGMGADASNLIAGVGAVKDASKLEAYISKKHPTSEVKKEKDYSYVSVDGDNMIAWDNELAVFITSQQTYAGGMEYDSVTHTFNLKRPGNNSNDLKNEIDTYFTLKEDNSVAGIPEFRDLMQEKGDASLWVNSGASLESFPVTLPNARELLANSYTAATLNFEDGKIDIKSKSYYSKQLRDILKKYTGPVANVDLIEHYPSNNINGFLVFAFNPQVISAVVRYLEVGGVVDNFLTKTMGTNYTLQEALKAIKGDIAVMFSDFQIGSPKAMSETIEGRSFQTVTYNSGNLLINVPVGDKVEMRKLMDNLAKNGIVTKANNEYKLTQQVRGLGFKLSVDDNNLLMATDSLLIAKYKSRAGKLKIGNDVMNDFKGKSAVFYLDVENILNGVAGHPADTSNQKILTAAKETFKDVKAYTNNFNGKYVEGHCEIRFKNDKENSLTSLLQFMNTASEVWGTDKHNQSNKVGSEDSNL
jgi:hypothetical protein